MLSRSEGYQARQETCDNEEGIWILEKEDLEILEQRSEEGSRRKRRRSPAAACWDSKHLRSVGTKLPVDLGKRFMVVCFLEGVTPYALLRGYLEMWVAMAERRQVPSDLVAARAILDSLGWDWKQAHSSAMLKELRRGS